MKRINLALQGGGAHGAFAWGVLDRIAEDPRLEIEGICGTSAGAMNAAIAAHGLATGGPAGMKAALAAFWGRVAEIGAFSPLRGAADWSPLWLWLDGCTRVLSPYQFNPLNYNPLRAILDEQLDCGDLRQAPVKLFVCASNVLTGKIKVFSNEDVSIDAVLASACLPHLFQAVEIDGEHYWDGGFMGNPPIYPLIYHCQSRDVVIVTLNPMAIPEVPTTAQAIADRVNTLSFNSSLMREMRAIHFVTRLIDGGYDDGGRLKRMLIHMVEDEALFQGLGVASKFDAAGPFLAHLRRRGWLACDGFLAANYERLGNSSSVDLAGRFL
ncbi:MAG: patatin-like phospholipase family protein [Thalassobaculales bacterium]